MLDILQYVRNNNPPAFPNVTIYAIIRVYGSPLSYRPDINLHHPRYTLVVLETNANKNRIYPNVLMYAQNSPTKGVSDMPSDYQVSLGPIISESPP